ncbi:MAG: ABC transporter substrate-binding protein [Chitinophagales bacterium]|nr:ABC transporter substrate-binding protein [Chitinophagales bacterium]
MKRVLYIAAVAAIVWIAYGCKSCGGKKDKTAPKIFRYNQSGGVTSLDPAMASTLANIWVVNQLYNTLLQLDDSLRIQPCIAHSYEISSDRLTYTFHLRTDVYFHDDTCFPGGKGRRLNARDVVYSFYRLIDPATLAKGAWVFNGRVSEKDPFTAPDDSTFVLKLRAPFAPMTGILTMPYCAIVPREAVQKYGAAFRAHPVGTGPFRFRQWRENVAILLEKNENYFEYENGHRLPYLDGVKISFISDTKTEFLEFRKNNLDFISGIDGAYIDEVLRDDGTLRDELKDLYHFQRSAYLNTEYLGFLMTGTAAEPVLQNKKVRQAINYAIDREEIIRYLRNGVGKPAIHGFVPEGFSGYEQSRIAGYTYQPQKARQLLAEAGYHAGNPLPTIKLYTSDKYQQYALLVAKQLEQAGISLKVELLQSSLLSEMKSSGKATFFRASLVGDYADPETYLAAFYGKHIAPPNYTRFNHPRYNALYEKAVQEPDQTKRYAYYYEMEKILLDEAPLVPLYYDEVIRFSRKNVWLPHPNAMNLLNLKHAKISD